MRNFMLNKQVGQIKVSNQNIINYNDTIPN